MRLQKSVDNKVFVDVLDVTVSPVVFAPDNTAPFYRLQDTNVEGLTSESRSVYMPSLFTPVLTLTKGMSAGKLGFIELATGGWDSGIQKGTTFLERKTTGDWMPYRQLSGDIPSTQIFDALTPVSFRAYKTVGVSTSLRSPVIAYTPQAVTSCVITGSSLTATTASITINSASPNAQYFTVFERSQSHANVITGVTLPHTFTVNTFNSAYDTDISVVAWDGCNNFTSNIVSLRQAPAVTPTGVSVVQSTQKASICTVSWNHNANNTAYITVIKAGEAVVFDNSATPSKTGPITADLEAGGTNPASGVTTYAVSVTAYNTLGASAPANVSYQAQYAVDYSVAWSRDGKNLIATIPPTRNTQYIVVYGGVSTTHNAIPNANTVISREVTASLSTTITPIYRQNSNIHFNKAQQHTPVAPVTVTGLTYNKAANTLSWNASGNPAETKYAVRNVGSNAYYNTAVTGTSISLNVTTDTTFGVFAYQGTWTSPSAWLAGEAQTTYVAPPAQVVYKYGLDGDAGRTDPKAYQISRETLAELNRTYTYFDVTLTGAGGGGGDGGNEGGYGGGGGGGRRASTTHAVLSQHLAVWHIVIGTGGSPALGGIHGGGGGEGTAFVTNATSCHLEQGESGFADMHLGGGGGGGAGGGNGADSAGGGYGGDGGPYTSTGLPYIFSEGSHGDTYRGGFIGGGNGYTQAVFYASSGLDGQCILTFHN